MVKLLVEEQFPSDLNDNEKLLTSLISELLDIVEIKIIENVEVAYYWEYRGRVEKNLLQVPRFQQFIH